MNITQLARTADLTDESSMCDVLELITARATGSAALYLSCVDLGDPSQMYDALIHFGAFAIGNDFHAFGEE